jgi:hypothetical protein
MSQIAQAKPARLYVAADGPRSKDEEEVCRTVRRIATDVSWDCEVKTLFREQNVGCKLGVSGAIDWLFANEEKGIILEDDCIPSQSFFRFCDELLLRYENDERIGAIAGSSYLKTGSILESYYFSRYPQIWGWATWARAWRNFDIEMTAWPRLRRTEFLSRIGGESPGFDRFWSDIFDQCHAGKIPTWDYQWLLSFWRHGYSACAPTTNLVANIGFEGDGTNNIRYNEVYHGRVACEVAFPLHHPSTHRQRPDLDAIIDHALSVKKRAYQVFIYRYIPYGRGIWRIGASAYRWAKATREQGRALVRRPGCAP